MIQTRLVLLMVTCFGCGDGKFLIKNRGNHKCDKCGGVAQKVTYDTNHFIDSDGSLWDHSGINLINKSPKIEKTY